MNCHKVIFKISRNSGEDEMPRKHRSPVTFVIADTHFGDENIRLYEERPFRDTEEMDNEMIRRCNSVVTYDHLVSHLGDFCSQ